MIEETLKSIGLSENEIKVFLIVFQYKKILPSRVSKLSGVNRSTVYLISKRLEEIGLINIDFGSATRYFIAPTIEELRKNLGHEELKLRKKQNSLKQLVEDIQHLPTAGKFSVPKIRFVDEINLGDFLIKESDKWAESALRYDKTWWGYQDPSLLKFYESWPDYFWPKYGDKIVLNIFTNKATEEKQLSKKEYARSRNTKYLDPKTHGFSATQVVVGEYILMIMTREHPHYLIEIKDSVMADNLREVFKLLWNQSL